MNTVARYYGTNTLWLEWIKQRTRNWNNKRIYKYWKIYYIDYNMWAIFSLE